MRPLLASLLIGILLSSCAGIGDSWRDGITRRAAADQIMLVSSQPPTLGHQRLASQQQVYKDLATFLKARGWPDFLAETANDGRRYLILYYLDRRQAFAARTRRPDDRTIEFAGPYPITDREFEMLGNLKASFKKGAARP
jgi:hypothetical protein